MTVALLISESASVGISLHLDGDRLRWKASAPPSGELLDKLKASKADIITYPQRLASDLPDPTDDHLLGDGIVARAIRDQRQAKREARSPGYRRSANEALPARRVLSSDTRAFEIDPLRRTDVSPKTQPDIVGRPVAIAKIDGKPAVVPKDLIAAQDKIAADPSLVQAIVDAMGWTRAETDDVLRGKVDVRHQDWEPFLVATGLDPERFADVFPPDDE